MIEEIDIQEGFRVITLNNKSEEELTYLKGVENTFIQLHFCVNCESSLFFNEHYSLGMKENKSILLYNPKQNLPINLTVQPKGKHLILIVSIKIFHSFFSKVAGLIPFLNEENKDKKYYLDKDLTPSEVLILNQIFKDNMQSSLHELYLKGKIYELLSLYFNKSEENATGCPFLEDEDNVEKIKKAKQIVINNMADPPSLQQIADEIVLSVPKLKEGFKHIYGDTVFNFLLDYKLEYARKLLLSKKHNISEISMQIGYSTASHFISAFKKKYGTTPKQYMMSL
ncbi:MAG: AraC family transcriptional regulator [Flavobacterium sp.]|nr:MAG: AraC family transcriptional regulator [Flavobacterium sp.]